MMNPAPKNRFAPTEKINHLIIFVRGQRVILDADLAGLYGVPTKAFNQAIKRNLKRFPVDFMFRLNPREANNLRSQFVTSSWGGRRYLPQAFTEHGAIMAASVLNSSRAVAVSISVVRAFVNLRRVLASHQDLARKITELERRFAGKTDEHARLIKQLYHLLDALITPPVPPPKKLIGFSRD